MSAQRSNTATLALPLADALLHGAPAIAVHWLERLAAVLPRHGADPDDVGMEDPELRLERAQRVVDGVARTLAATTAREESSDPRPLGGGGDMLTLAGWEYGVATHAAGRPLPEVAQDFHLLYAILLHECERGATAAARYAVSAVEDEVVTLGDAFRVARRLHDAVGLAATAAVSGHAQEGVVAARARLRTLRHDLRNPIATIQNVVSLMQDEGMPLEARNDPRYAGMLHRNTTALGDLVTRELGDGAVMGPGRLEGPVHLESVASSVRRSLRAELESHGVGLEIAAELPVIRADATTLALALRAAIAAAVRLTPAGGVLRLTAEVPVAREGERVPRLRVRLAGLPDAGASQQGQEPALHGETREEVCRDASEVASRVGGRLLLEDAAISFELS